jgi:hypothetical protein
MNTIPRALLFLGLATIAGAQQFEMNLDHLAAKASDTVDLSLNSATLQFAAKFLDGKDPEEAKVKKLISGIEGIYVKAYEFKNGGAWSQADLDGVRNQLRGPEWSRIASVTSKEEGEAVELFVRTENKKTTGIALLASEAKSLTVVNIAGSVDLDALSDLGGHFGVPKVEITPPPRKK